MSKFGRTNFSACHTRLRGPWDGTEVFLLPVLPLEPPQIVCRLTWGLSVLWLRCRERPSVPTTGCGDTV